MTMTEQPSELSPSQQEWAQVSEGDPLAYPTRAGIEDETGNIETED